MERRPAFESAACSLPTRIAETFFGGGGTGGGFSVSSGEPPAHAIEGVITLPWFRSLRSVGSEINTKSAVTPKTSLSTRGRRPMSAGPSDKANEGGRLHHGRPRAKRERFGEGAPPIH